jgi:hypothetical protein
MSEQRSRYSTVRPDEMERLIAFQDYRRMALNERSVDRLWRTYCERRRNGDKNVPTTTRSKLYRWVREDAWDERIAAEEREALEVEKTEQLQARRAQQAKMWEMVPEANQALREIITSCEDPAVRLRAVVALLDRLGVVPETTPERRRKPAADGEAASPPKAAEMTIPSPDAGEDVWAKWFAEQGGEVA